MCIATVVEKTINTEKSVLHQLSLHEVWAIICACSTESYYGLESYRSEIAMQMEHLLKVVWNFKVGHIEITNRTTFQSGLVKSLYWNQTNLMIFNWIFFSRNRKIPAKCCWTVKKAVHHSAICLWTILLSFVCTIMFCW